MHADCTTNNLPEILDMKIATLAIILQDGSVLLGEKKKGEIGTGVLSGPGGKLDPGETLVECLLRETREELAIELDPAALEMVAVIDIYAAGEIDFRVYVYHTGLFSGDIKETADMIPAWYPIDNLPFDKMFESDRHWFLKAVRGEKFNAKVQYLERAKSFAEIKFSAFELM